jgi:hypothetical protein
MSCWLQICYLCEASLMQLLPELAENTVQYLELDKSLKNQSLSTYKVWQALCSAFLITIKTH